MSCITVERVKGRSSGRLYPNAIVRFACASASMSSTFFPCCASPTPRLTAVVVLPTPPFWFVRAITLQFDIDASSFRINLATLSGWLCKVPQNAKKPTGFDTNRLCKIFNIQLLTFAASSSRISSVSHLSGNSTAIMRKASYRPAIYAWVAYSISCLSRHSTGGYRLSAVPLSNPIGDSAFPQSPHFQSPPDKLRLLPTAERSSFPSVFPQLP